MSAIQIQLLNTDMPQSIPCANCGKQAHLEDYTFDDTGHTFDFDDEGVHVLFYQCYHCKWWTDWEISIEEGAVESSSLYFLEDLESDSIHWQEAREWPHFWMPDGLTIPEKMRVMPKRIQRKREKGWKMPENCIYVGRPTKWGNRFPPEKEIKISMALFDRDLDNVRIKLSLEQSLAVYEGWLDYQLESDPEFLKPLREADYLACFCPLSQPCHVDIIIEYLEKGY